MTEALQLPGAPEHPDQLRLSRIQVCNWGTLDGYHDVEVPRKGFLITGGSGSGKSTLIDAVSAVLVPPAHLRFNAAAQEEASADPLVEAIEAIDADALSPREALDHIYRLKQLAAQRQHD